MLIRFYLPMFFQIRKMGKAALSAMIFIIIPLLTVSTTDSTARCKDYGGENPVCAVCSDEKSNYTVVKQQFGNNLNLLLDSLPSNTSVTGFNSSFVGDEPNRVYGRALCRGDVNQTACQDCVKNASREILNECKNQEAIIWNELCQVQYSSQVINLGVYTGKYPYRNFQENNVSDPDDFEQVLTCLMNNLSSEAAFVSSRGMFATGEVKFSKKTVYGLAQCTRDISNISCSQCLEKARGDLMGCCSTHEGGTILSRDCNVRFDVDRFYNASSFLLKCSTSKGNQWNKEMLVAVICIPTLLLAVLVGCCVAYFWWKKRKRKDVEGSNHGLLVELASPIRHTNIIGQENDFVSSQELPFMDFLAIRAATDDFADSNKLGQGGFGFVYKGVLPNGKEIAVKRLSRKSLQGLEDFKNEIILIAKLQHRNLVRLLGCGLEGEEKLLIYEFMPNRSLDIFIFDSERRKQLEWKTCYNIIGGIARGLVYLHEDSRLRIIHRDLKPSNVLLDSEMVAKISDFGMARIFCENQNTANTKRVVGTYGYMAPEYAMEGLFSVKSDVFSFGVLVLEIINGKRNSGFYLAEHHQTLLAYAWRLWNEGKELEPVDPSLMESYSTSQVVRCMHIGLLCVQEDPADRPTMSSVVALLGTESISLPEPRQPAVSVVIIITIDQPSTSNPDPSVNMMTVSSISPR